MFTRAHFLKGAFVHEDTIALRAPKSLSPVPTSSPLYTTLCRYESEWNPNNCAVRLITERSGDEGYIFNGFDSSDPTKVAASPYAFAQKKVRVCSALSDFVRTSALYFAFGNEPLLFGSEEMCMVSTRVSRARLVWRTTSSPYWGRRFAHTHPFAEALAPATSVTSTRPYWHRICHAHTHTQTVEVTKELSAVRRKSRESGLLNSPVQSRVRTSARFFVTFLLRVGFLLASDLTAQSNPPPPFFPFFPCHLTVQAHQMFLSPYTQWQAYVHIDTYPHTNTHTHARTQAHHRGRPRRPGSSKHMLHPHSHTLAHHQPTHVKRIRAHPRSHLRSLSHLLLTRSCVLQRRARSSSQSVSYTHLTLPTIA